jgi:hypothetical protein
MPNMEKGTQTRHQNEGISLLSARIFSHMSRLFVRSTNSKLKFETPHGTIQNISLTAIKHYKQENEIPSPAYRMSKGKH